MYIDIKSVPQYRVCSFNFIEIDLEASMTRGLSHPVGEAAMSSLYPFLKAVGDRNPHYHPRCICERK